MRKTGAILIRHIAATLPDGYAERRALIGDALEVISKLDPTPEGQTALLEMADYFAKADAAQMSLFQN